MKQVICFFYLIAPIFAFANDGDVYQCVDEKGKVEYKNGGSVIGCKKVDLPGIEFAPDPSSSLKPIYKSKSTNTIYIDSKSLSIKGNIRKAWFFESLSSPSKIQFKTYQSMKTFTIVDCKDNQFQTMQTIYYADNAGKGDAVYSSPDTLESKTFHPNVPGSIGESISKNVCNLPAR